MCCIHFCPRIPGYGSKMSSKCVARILAFLQVQESSKCVSQCPHKPCWGCKGPQNVFLLYTRISLYYSSPCPFQLFEAKISQFYHRRGLCKKIIQENANSGSECRKYILSNHVNLTTVDLRKIVIFQECKIVNVFEMCLFPVFKYFCLLKSIDNKDYTDFGIY